MKVLFVGKSLWALFCQSEFISDSNFIVLLRQFDVAPLIVLECHCEASSNFKTIISCLCGVSRNDVCISKFEFLWPGEIYKSGNFQEVCTWVLP